MGILMKNENVYRFKSKAELELEKKLQDQLYIMEVQNSSILLMQSKIKELEEIKAHLEELLMHNPVILDFKNKKILSKEDVKQIEYNDIEK